MAEVTAIRTPTSPLEAESALKRAWRSMYGETVSEDVLALLLAIWDLETGTGESQYHWNMGNIVTSSDTYFMLRSAGNHHYRIYDSLDDGARGLIRQLRSPNRPQWEDGLLSGDPVFFIESLKGVHGGGFEYFEAPLERYLTTFMGRYARYAPNPKVESPAPPSDLSPWQQSGFSYGFEVNVNCLGLPVIGVDSEKRWHVIVAQSLLNFLADPKLKIDGVYGPKTQKATLDYQLEHSLVATGTIDSLTWASLINTMKET